MEEISASVSTGLESPPSLCFRGRLRYSGPISFSDRHLYESFPGEPPGILVYVDAEERSALGDDARYALFLGECGPCTDTAPECVEISGELRFSCGLNGTYFFAPPMTGDEGRIGRLGLPQQSVRELGIAGGLEYRMRLSRDPGFMPAGSAGRA